MGEIIRAEKCKDGWYVKVIKTYHKYSEDDVIELIKQEGLEIFSRSAEQIIGYKK